jgi:hypothetical protein
MFKLKLHAEHLSNVSQLLTFMLCEYRSWCKCVLRVHVPTSLVLIESAQVLSIASLYAKIDEFCNHAAFHVRKWHSWFDERNLLLTHVNL